MNPGPRQRTSMAPVAALIGVAALLAVGLYLDARSKPAKLEARDAQIAELQAELDELDAMTAEVEDFAQKQDDLRQLLDDIEAIQQEGAPMGQVIEAMAIVAAADDTGIESASMNLRTVDDGPQAWFHTGEIEAAALAAYVEALRARPCVQEVHGDDPETTPEAERVSFELRLDLDPECQPEDPAPQPGESTHE